MVVKKVKEGKAWHFMAHVNNFMQILWRMAHNTKQSSHSTIFNILIKDPITESQNKNKNQTTQILKPQLSFTMETMKEDVEEYS